MELFVKDRIYIPAILPAEGSFLDFNLKRSILGKVALTDGDREKYSIVENREKNSVTWDVAVDAANPIKVEFTTEEVAYLKRTCEALGDSGAKLPDDMWFVVEKIYKA